MILNDENLFLIEEFAKGYLERVNNDLDYASSRDAKGNKRNFENELFTYVSMLASYDGFPSILKDKDFEVLDRKLLFHGFSKHRHGASYILDFAVHNGNGDFGQGFYLTDSYDDAKTFTGGEKWDKSLVLKNKVMPAKAIKYSALREIANNSSLELDGFDLETQTNITKLNEFVSSIENQEIKNMLTDAIFKVPGVNASFNGLGDYSTLAVILGFDIIENDMKHEFFDGKHYILLNRKKLVVPESEFKVIRRKAKENYEDIGYKTISLSELTQENYNE